MEEKQSFFKRNKMFILIMSILLCIIISLLIYIFMDKLEEINNRPVDVPVDTQNPTQADAKIIEFDANYNRSSDSVIFDWNYQSGSNEIEKVSLYQGDVFLTDVTSYRNWILSRENYGLTTGMNDFTLVITQKNGKKIKQSTQVFVKYVVKLNQTIEQKEGKTRLTLEYQYHKDHPVNVPRLMILDDSINYTRLDYIATTYKEEGNMVKAKSVYEFTWYEHPVEYQQVYVRWSFTDINDNVDYMIDKGTPPKADKDKKE